MSEERKSRLPKKHAPRCVVCGEEITDPPFIASKPRRGRTIYAHTRCLEEEQRSLKSLKGNEENESKSTERMESPASLAKGKA